MAASAGGRRRAPAEYADEAWSRLVGNVTGQHVGRLRRVAERFDALRAQLTALFWSHFQAALDWSDAEMWLEGASQSGWSVAEMRRRRWDTLSAVEADLRGAEEAVTEPTDEDFDPAAADAEPVLPPGDDPQGGDRSSHDPDRAAADRLSLPTGAGDHESRDAADAPFDADPPTETPHVAPRPFAHLAEMPDDLGEAFEAFKLAIIRHKFAGWQAIGRDDLVAAIDALRELALAPAE